MRRALAILSALILPVASFAASSSVNYPSSSGGNVHWKAPVASSAALPAGGNSVGDARFETTNFGVYVWNGSTWVAGVTGGSVTSVGLSLPSEFNVTGSPVTGSGTLTGAWADQTANKIFAGPASGADAAPSFRDLVLDDLKMFVSSFTTGSIPYWDGTQFNEDNANLNYDSTGKMLTAPPTLALHGASGTGATVGHDGTNDSWVDYCGSSGGLSSGGCLEIHGTNSGGGNGGNLFAIPGTAGSYFAIYDHTGNIERFNFGEDGTAKFDAYGAGFAKFAADGTISSTALSSGDIPNNAADTSGNAATATALAADPTDCAADQFANSIDSGGNLTCGQVAYSQLSGTPTLYYQTVQSGGTDQTQRGKLNFSTNFSLSDSSLNDRTDVDLAATISSDTTGSAAGLSAASDLPDGTTATTQAASDNSTKVATTAYVDAAVAAGGGGSGSLSNTVVSTSGTRTPTQSALSSLIVTAPTTQTLSSCASTGPWNYDVVNMSGATVVLASSASETFSDGYTSGSTTYAISEPGTVATVRCATTGVLYVTVSP